MGIYSASCRSFYGHRSDERFELDEKVTVTFEPHGILKIHSVCSFPQIFDWGKNKRNVEVFIERFSIRELRNSKGSEEPEYFDSEGKTPLGRAMTDSESDADPDDVTK